MAVTHHPTIDLSKVRPSKKTQAEKKNEALKKELTSKNARWQAVQTPHSYMTIAQKQYLLGATPPNTSLLAQIQSAAIIPQVFIPTFDPEVDWRTKNGGKVSPIKDQGLCGSCVSHGTVAAIESMALIEKNVLLDLSEADLHFCSSHGANCGGWYPWFSVDEVRERGVCDEARFPYASAFVNGNATCILAPDRAQHVYKIQSSNWVIFDAFRKDHLTHHGPMIACMSVYDDFFSYGGGVYHHVSGNLAGGHCVLVIGYSQSQGCWICKNSWGTGWGEAGFFQIAYGQCGIDSLISPFFGVQGVILP